MRFALHADRFAAAAKITFFVRACKILASVLPQYCAARAAHCLGRSCRIHLAERGLMKT
jgi:hypothetical protein